MKTGLIYGGLVLFLLSSIGRRQKINGTKQNLTVKDSIQIFSDSLFLI